MATPLQPQQLGDIFSMNPGAFAQAQQMVQMNMQGAQQQQQADLQKMLFEQQMQPLKMQEQQGINAARDAQLPGLQAISAGQVRNQQVNDAIPVDEEAKAKLYRMYTQLSDDQVKQHDNALKMALQDPSESVRNAAAKMLQFTKEFQLQKMKDEADQQRAVDVANINAGAREKVAATAAAAKTAAGTVDFWATFNKLKNARDKHAALISEAAKLKATSPDNPQIAVLEAMAESIRPQAEAEIATAKPGGPNLQAMDIPTTPGPSIAPRAGKAPVTNTPIPPGAIEMLKKNPGLAAKFDEKYGPGASKKYLGQ